MMKAEDVTFEKIKQSNSLEELYNFKMQLAEDICNIRCQLLNTEYYSYQDEVYGKTSDEETLIQEKDRLIKKKLALEKKIAQKEIVEASIDNIKFMSEVAEGLSE